MKYGNFTQNIYMFFINIQIIVFLSSIYQYWPFFSIFGGGHLEKPFWIFCGFCIILLKKNTAPKAICMCIVNLASLIGDQHGLR